MTLHNIPVHSTARLAEMLAKLERNPEAGMAGLYLATRIRTELEKRRKARRAH